MSYGYKTKENIIRQLQFWLKNPAKELKMSFNNTCTPYVWVVPSLDSDVFLEWAVSGEGGASKDNESGALVLPVKGSGGWKSIRKKRKITIDCYKPATSCIFNMVQ